MNLDILRELDETIEKRKTDASGQSYTKNLFDAGENKIVKKLGEENAEFIKAFLTESKREIACEAADYLYHLTVALHYKGLGLEQVLKVLEERHQGDK